jgi:hypothetical protein
MNDNTSLQNMNDLVTPGPVPWWPLAPGWYGLAVIVVAALLVFAFIMWRRWQRERYRRQALLELSAMRAGTAGSLDLLPALLKRAALAVWPREVVASLSGAGWHRFLDESAQMDQFCSGAGELLDQLAYVSGRTESLADAERNRLLEAAEFWLKHHRYQPEAVQ